MLFPVLIFLTGCLIRLHGYSTGPPDTACATLEPSHGIGPRSSTCPFKVTVSKTTYTPGNHLQVTLAGLTASDQFKGFMIQARSSLTSALTHGTFTFPAADAINPCNSLNAVAHSNNNLKSSITFQWTAPSADVGDITFLFAVVQTKSTYWIQQSSAPISYLAPTTQAPTTQAPTTQAATTQAPSTQAPTTQAPTTQASTTQAPTTQAPTTQALTTQGPTTQATTTQASTTQAPTTQGPTTQSPTTQAPITQAPTTQAPTTQPPTTQAPTTPAPTTQAPITQAPTTQAPITQAPTTQAPTTQATSTQAPTQQAPTTQAPITQGPATLASATTTKAIQVSSAAQTTTTPTTDTATNTSKFSTTTFPNTTPISTTTASQTAEVPLEDTVDRDKECENSKSCFPSPTVCSTDCNFLVTWSLLGLDEVEFTLQRQVPLGNYYMAIAFSEDPAMGNDSVVACVSYNGGVDVDGSYNGNYVNERFDDPRFGVTLVTGSHVNGVLSCTFRRQINSFLTSGTTNDKSRFFDLTIPWYLFVATGSSYNGTITMHTAIPRQSDGPIQFVPKVPTPTSPAQATIDRDVACESTKSCFPSQSVCSLDCDYLVTWFKVGLDDVEFTLKTKTFSNSYYIAIGFSSDPVMSDDSVVQCVTNNGQIDVISSYTPGYYNERLSDPTYGVDVQNASLQNGVLSCTFRRKKNVNVITSSTTDFSSKFFDLTQDWHLLVAYGSSISGYISKHDQLPSVSTDKLNFMLSPSTSKIVRDGACESTKSCFPSASVCSTGCDYLVTWSKVGQEDVEFTLKKKTSSNNYYIAIGFSDDPKMTNDSVIQCVSYNGIVEVLSAYNPMYYNLVLENSKYGISQLATSYTNGILSCTFRRKLTAAIAEASIGFQRNKRSSHTSGRFFDLTTPWYLLVAHGPAVAGSLTKHGEVPAVSQDPIDFTRLHVTAVTTPSPNTTTLRKSSECGYTRGCFHDCDEDQCGFLLSWTDQVDRVALSLSCKRTGNGYCAVGLSIDDKMGDDSVFECISSSGIVTGQLSYNQGRVNSPLDDKTFGLTVTVASHENGVLRCDMTRMKTYDLAAAGQSQGRKKRAAVSASTYFSMNKDWTLLFASGNAVGGYKMQHTSVPTVSRQTADFQSTQDIGAVSVDRMLIRIHGILMVLAWMLFASIGITMARFYKPVWMKDSMNWCGQRRWFVVHRLCMIMVFLLTAGAFAVIFIHVKGYADIRGNWFEKSHPNVGIVVMVLSIVNPIMALLRPHPDGKNRPVFNAAHALVGWAAYICSVLNLFSGTLLTAANVPAYIRYILWVFTGWMVLYSITCELSTYMEQHADRSKRLRYETGDSIQAKRKIHTYKLMVLPVHLFVVFALSTTVVIFLALFS